VSRTLSKVTKIEIGDTGTVEVVGSGSLQLPAGTTSGDTSFYIRKSNSSIQPVATQDFVFTVLGDPHYDWFAYGASIFVYSRGTPTAHAIGTIQSYVHAEGGNGSLTIRFDSVTGITGAFSDWNIGSNAKFGALRYDETLEAVTMAVKESVADKIVFRTHDNQPGSYISLSNTNGSTFGNLNISDIADGSPVNGKVLGVDASAQSRLFPVATPSQAELGTGNEIMTSLGVRQSITATVDLDIVRLGVPVDGTTNAVSALQAIASGPLPEINLGRTYPEGAVSGGLLLDGQVQVPWHKPLVGVGRQSRIVAKTALTDPTKEFFALNTDGNGSWADPNRPFPGILSGEVGNFFIYFDVAAAAGNVLTFSEFGGSQHFHDIHAGGVQTIAKQIATYCDQVWISRVVAYNQPSATGYLFDLGTGGGDSLIIDSLHTVPFVHGSDPSLNRRVRAVSAKHRAGGSIRGSINGDYLIDSSSAIAMESGHMEQGITEIRDSAMSLRDMVYYMRGPTRGDWYHTPVQITYDPISAPQKPTVAGLENIGFLYVPSLPGRYSTDLPNFSIKTSPLTSSAIVEVRRCWRQWHSLLGSNIGPRMGITCGMVDFDRYSHLASLQSTFVAEKWRIRGNLPELATTTGLASATLVNEDTWQAASTTRYYKAQIIYDTMRCLGRTGSAEVSAVLVNGASAATLTLPTDSRYGAIVRLYSGPSTGSYDKYVDIPLLAGAFLVDNGNDVCGFPWISRAAGAVDTLNALQILSYELVPGPTEAGADAYGNVIIHVKGDAVVPTVGSWRRGDEIIVETGPTNRSEVLRGWVRRTSCLLSAPANVLNTDWLADWHNMGDAVDYINTDFTAIGSTLNTVNKRRSIERWDVTSGQFLRAQNETAAGAWLSRAGATVYTPA